MRTGGSPGRHEHWAAARRTWWTDTLAEHGADARNMFVETLARWPSRPVPPEPDTNCMSVVIQAS